MVIDLTVHRSKCWHGQVTRQWTSPTLTLSTTVDQFFLAYTVTCEQSSGHHPRSHPQQPLIISFGIHSYIVNTDGIIQSSHRQCGNSCTTRAKVSQVCG